MPIEKSISFRSSLNSNISDLTERVGWNCARTSSLMAGLVSQLAAYTEEGVVMTPSVFVCNSISVLIKLAGVGESIPLSDTIPIESAGPKILKAAAPLCSGNWRIYIERCNDGRHCRFGVFCGLSDPSSLTVDEIVLDEYDENFPVVRIVQSSTNKVQVRTSAGDVIEFRFNNDQDIEELKANEHLKSLSSAIADKCEWADGAFVGYVERILTSAVRDSHGTLIAVVAAEANPLPLSLSDVVAITPAFQLFDRFKQHLEGGKSASTVSTLQAASELVSGFISSDGITVFDDAGAIRGYRAFVRSDAGTTPAAGGARTRAYEALKAAVGKDLRAAFFRSQDGRTDFVESVGPAQ